MKGEASEEQGDDMGEKAFIGTCSSGSHALRERLHTVQCLEKRAHPMASTLVFSQTLMGTNLN